MISRKEAAEPALSSIMRSKRVQFLPVQWRSSLKTQLDEERVKRDDGLDNVFTMADITQKGSIPYVRELTNNMLLDIPLFMSHHRERMIQSVRRFTLYEFMKVTVCAAVHLTVIMTGSDCRFVHKRKAFYLFVETMAGHVVLAHALIVPHQSLDSNRAYRLWCARNPSFEKNGRVVSSPLLIIGVNCSR